MVNITFIVSTLKYNKNCTKKTDFLLNVTVDCVWGSWKESDCSATCGKESFRTKTRKVIKQATNGGKCTGKGQVIETCNLDPCPRKNFFHIKIQYQNLTQHNFQHITNNPFLFISH